MKGHHKRKMRNTGGVNEAAEDLDHKNMEYTKDSNVNREAVERKHGGKAKHKMHKKHGGNAEHHAKHVGHIEGHHAKHHAGRLPRKQGGGTYSDSNPFTSARKGTPPPGRKLDMEME